MNRAGRPLRFLAVVAFGWVGARTALLWPGAPGAPLLATFSAPLAASPAVPAPVQVPVSVPTAAAARLTIRLDDPAPQAGIASMVAVAPSASASASTAAAPPRTPMVAVAMPHRLLVVAPGDPVGGMTKTARLAISVWAIVRGDGPASLAGGGQLGGSQIGARAAFALDRDRRINLFGRLSTPLAMRSGREAAVGLDWQPVPGAPVRIAVERRQSLGGGRNAFALGVFGGVDSIPLAAGFSLDGYGQAGLVGLRQRDGYADGAVRVERRLATIGPVRFAIGGGVWGGIQPHLHRLDVGPQLVARLPAGGATLRLAVDWRQRVAGNARPNSGPALSVGADF